MALAQVVYQISTDKDFALRMQSNPQAALKEGGWSLSKEEIAFLLSTLKNSAGPTEIRKLVHTKFYWKW
jgi:hypothetical protein